jgi:hypothetical protein
VFIVQSFDALLENKALFNITLHLNVKINNRLFLSTFFIHQLMHKWTVLKTVLKFTLKLTLKQLQHVSVQSPSSESALFELAKVTVVKIIN